MYLRFWLVSLLIPLCVSVNEAEELDRPVEKDFLAFCKWTSHDEVLLKDLDDGELDQHTLIRAALIAAGNDLEQAAKLEASFAAKGRFFRSSHMHLHLSNQSDVRTVFSYFRKNYLSGDYVPDLCDAGESITNEKFNCLTATVLFQLLCHHFDAEVEAVWEPSHVRCWLPVNDGHFGFLVETTASTSHAAVSEKLPRIQVVGRSLSKEQLLGKVFYNRGVRQLQQDAFSQALSSTWAGCLLDSRDVPAQNNLRACINNWALRASTDGGDLPFAIRLLDAGLQLDPSYEPFSRNLRLLRNN